MVQKKGFFRKMQRTMCLMDRFSFKKLALNMVKFLRKTPIFRQ